MVILSKNENAKNEKKYLASVRQRTKEMTSKHQHVVGSTASAGRIAPCPHQEFVLAYCLPTHKAKGNAHHTCPPHTQGCKLFGQCTQRTPQSLVGRWQAHLVPFDGASRKSYSSLQMPTLTRSHFSNCSGHGCCCCPLFCKAQTPLLIPTARMPVLFSPHQAVLCTEAPPFAPSGYCPLPIELQSQLNINRCRYVTSMEQPNNR